MTNEPVSFMVQICFQNASMPRILSETALNKKVLKQLGDLQLGDLVEVSWLDVSKGSKENM